MGRAIKLYIRRINSQYFFRTARAIILFAILNLIILAIMYYSWILLGHFVYSSSSIAEMPGGTDSQGLSRSNSILTYGVLLALAICPIVLFMTTTLAGAASAKANAINDQGEVKKNGTITGFILWLVPALTGLIYFGLFIANGVMTTVGSIMRQASGFPIDTVINNMYWFVILSAHIVLPFIVMYYFFREFSIAGTDIFMRMSARQATLSHGSMNILKNILAIGGMAWIKRALIALIVIWPITLYYVLLMFIFNLH